MNGSQWYGADDANLVGALKEAADNLPGLKIDLSGIKETVRGLVEKTASLRTQNDTPDDLLQDPGCVPSR